MLLAQFCGMTKLIHCYIASSIYNMYARTLLRWVYVMRLVGEPSYGHSDIFYSVDVRWVLRGLAQIAIRKYCGSEYIP